MNEFEKIAKDVVHAVEWPFKHAEELIAVLKTVLDKEPQIKDAVIGLVGAIATIGKDGALAVAAGGGNITEDMQTIADAKLLWQYVTAEFLPAVESAWSDLKADTEIADTAIAGTASPIAASETSTLAAQ